MANNARYEMPPVYQHLLRLETAALLAKIERDEGWREMADGANQMRELVLRFFGIEDEEDQAE